MMVFYPTIIPDYPNQQPPKEIHQAFIRYLEPGHGDTVASVEPPQHQDPINPDWLDEPDTGEEEEE